MINFVLPIFLTALFAFALHKKFIVDVRMIFFLFLGIFTTSLIGSLSNPYITDDVDHFHNLALAIQNSRLMEWLFLPHNEHVIPLPKLMYVVCYQLFWLDPIVFHVVVVAVSVGNIILVYRLLLGFTGSTASALLGSAIMTATNLFDEAIFAGANSHILFCLFFFLLLFYAMQQYALHKEGKWRPIAFFSIILGPTFFALGLTSIVFIFLFWRFCLPPEGRRNLRSMLPLLMVAWVWSLIPYLYAMNGIIHADHYRDLGQRSLFDIAQFKAPVVFLVEYVFQKLIPFIITDYYISFGLFFLCIYAGVNYSKQVDWKKVGVFALFGLSNNFIIYVFRYAWGPGFLDFPRYYVFPAAMLAICYPLILDAFFKDQPKIKGVAVVLLTYILCFYIVASGGIKRHIHSEKYTKRTIYMQQFYVAFRKVFADFFSQYPQKETIQVKNSTFVMPAELSRYIRTRKFYAEYVLPPEIQKRIVWTTDKTDPDFLEYLQANGYVLLLD